jgi:hypothetical protein
MTCKQFEMNLYSDKGTRIPDERFGFWGLGLFVVESDGVSGNRGWMVLS